MAPHLHGSQLWVTISMGCIITGKGDRVTKQFIIQYSIHVHGQWWRWLSQVAKLNRQHNGNNTHLFCTQKYRNNAHSPCGHSSCDIQSWVQDWKHIDDLIHFRINTHGLGPCITDYTMIQRAHKHILHVKCMTMRCQQNSALMGSIPMGIII